MKFCSRILVLAIFASTLSLISCAGPSGYTYQNVSIQLSYNPICSGVCINGGIFTPVPAPKAAGDQVGPTGAVEMPVGGGSGSCLLIQAAVTNAPANLTWTVYPTPLFNNNNTGSASSATGTTNSYCEPNAIPVYTGAQLAQATALGIQQGETLLVVTAPADPNNPNNVASASIAFTSQLAGPPTGVVIGITQAPSVIVPLNGTYQFSGYVVGINGYVGVAAIPAKQITWAVTACTGTGAPAQVGGNYGTINAATGLYTAPAAYPSATFKCANITATSAAYPTVVSSVTTVNFP